MRTLIVDNLEQSTISNHVEMIMENIEFIKHKICSEVLFYNIKLALWEIFSNIINYEPVNDNQQIKILIHESAEEIELIIISVGEGFEWLKYKDMDCPGVEQIGGRGLYLLQQICYFFDYDDSGTKARLIFRKEKGE